MYVTVAEINQLLGTSGEDALIESLINGAESIFNDLINADSTNGLIEAEYMDRFPCGYTPNYYKYGLVFFLQHYRPTEIDTVNGISAGTQDVDFILEGQRLEFAIKKDEATAFPYGFRIVYTAGFPSDEIPKDIKLAVKYMVAALYNRKNTEGFSSFKQDLLSINYRDDGIMDTIKSSENSSFIQSVIVKYKVPFVIS